MGVIVLFAFSVLLGRMLYLQVFQYGVLFKQAENNRLAFVPIAPSRGLIYDRNGMVIAQNIPSYVLSINPHKTKDIEKTIQRLQQIVTISSRDIKRFQRHLRTFRPNELVVLRTHLSDEEVARLAANTYRFPEMDIQARLFRNYPYRDTASHVIGYIGSMNTKEQEDLKRASRLDNYLATEHIGKVGIEKNYESRLHGTSGLDEVETTAGGYVVRKLKSRPAIAGESIHLSIDIKLQKMIEDLFGNRRGALVAIDPSNGEVLALVSKPTFDLNIFLEGIDTETWELLKSSLDKPLMNRAIAGTYPPGSTYKPFMALAALEQGLRSPSYKVNDLGSYQFGSHTFRGHAVGIVDMKQSITYSSNVYYYDLANDMGVDTIYETMNPFGFGSLTGIDIQGEVTGVLPTQEWKRQYFAKPAQQRWYPGETISLGIGQGYNNFTPLQLANATAILANGGKRFIPRLVLAIQNVDHQKKHELQTHSLPALQFHQPHVDLIHEAMADVPLIGTAIAAFAGTPYRSAGKTGTAQAVSIENIEDYDAETIAEHERDHSLYIGFAPLEKPTIAVAAIVENAGFGSAAAAPIVRRVFDYWLLGDYPSKEDILAVQQGEALAPLEGI
jgi:penicillin-binding protein 2